MRKVSEIPDKAIEAIARDILTGRAHIENFYWMYDLETAMELGNISIAFQNGLLSKEHVDSCVRGFLRFHRCKSSQWGYAARDILSQDIPKVPHGV